MKTILHNKKWIALAITVAAILFFLLRNTDEENQIITVPVSTGAFKVSVTVTGELEAQDKALINAPSELTNSSLGYLQTKIQDIVPEGTIVDSGDYVARLDPSEIVNKLSQIEMEIVKQEANLFKARLDTALSIRNLRNQIKDLKYELEEKKLALKLSEFEPQATIRKAKLDLEKSNRMLDIALQNFEINIKKEETKITEAQMLLLEAQNQQEIYQQLIEKFTIYADKPGMVVYVRDRMGGAKGVGAEIAPWDLSVATLPDMSKMISKTFVNEIDINKIVKGQTVDVKLDAVEGKLYKGRVKTIANIGTQIPGTDTKVFEVQIEIEKTDSIMKPSMTTSNTIISQQLDEVLYVPMEAVHTNDSLSYVFTGNKKQVVELGPSNDNFVVIRRGLVKDQDIMLTVPQNEEDYRFNDIQASPLPANNITSNL